MCTDKHIDMYTSIYIHEYGYTFYIQICIYLLKVCGTLRPSAPDPVPTAGTRCTLDSDID